MTVAAFMELALYHPEHGYYSKTAQRSGRAGDFYTSVDVGPLFGELVAAQLAEMMALCVAPGEAIDLVEAAAGNGRLTRDVLDALAREWPDQYRRVRVHLVERSENARRAQGETLGAHRNTVASSGEAPPSHVHGVVYANELLDALPVHVAVMRADGLREVFIGIDGARLVEVEAAPSTPALQNYLGDIAVTLEPGARAEINLAAAEWMGDVARRLERGFVLLIDYGHFAPQLYNESHRDGTLRAFRVHTVSGNWLDAPGEQDLTSHVDFTGVSRAAEAAGLDVLGIVDQTRFLLALGALERIEQAEQTTSAIIALRRRLAAKTLLVPGGMGSTHHAMIFGKDVGRPALKGFSLANLVPGP